MTPSYHRRRLERGADQYRKKLDAAQAERDRLRDMAREANAAGVTIVDIADALGWSRQSVYDLIGSAK